MRLLIPAMTVTLCLIAHTDRKFVEFLCVSFYSFLRILYLQIILATFFTAPCMNIKAFQHLCDYSKILISVHNGVEWEINILSHGGKLETLVSRRICHKMY